MPKASKKKQKDADFQKTKLKLGKGKQQANNATDTSFRSRTIALPQQSINKDKSGRLVTSRNLGVTELSQQLRHYGAGVRKEAVLGIREILTTHPVLITSAVGQLIPDICRVIGDDDAAVRRNLFSLLSWYLPQIPSNLLSPYLNSLLLFTASALSHIYPEVRLDAVKVLDILVQIAPTAATTGWDKAVAGFVQPPVHSALSHGPSALGSSSLSSLPASGSSAAGADQTSHGERFMSCYLNLLGITRQSSSAASASDKPNMTQRTVSTTLTDLAPAAKLLIFKSLNGFLSAASGPLPTSSSHFIPATNGNQDRDAYVTTSSRQTTPVQAHCPTWFFRPSFQDPADFEHFQGLMRPDLRKRRARRLGVGDYGSDSARANMPRFPVADKSTSDGNGKARKQDARPEAETESDFLSADLGAGALVDVSLTAGRSWATSDLFASLTRAASQYVPQPQQQHGSPSRSVAVNGSNPRTGNGDGPSRSLHLFSLLQPVMVATFLDIAPSAFRPDMDLNAHATGRPAASQQNPGLSMQAEIVSHLVALCLTLWRASVSSSDTASGTSPISASRSQKTELGSLLGHMATYFPFSRQGASSVASLTTALSQKARMSVTEMDLGFSELTALLALSLGPEYLANESQRQRQQGVAGKNKIKINLVAQLGLVANYIAELLTTSASSSDVTAEVAGTVSLSGIGASLDPVTYESLLPTVWLLLNTASSSQGQGSALLEAVLEHYSKCGSSSKVKALAFEFIARLCTLQTFASYRVAASKASDGGVPFYVQDGSKMRAELGKWIEGLPRFLWEVTSSSSAYLNAAAGGATTPSKILEFLRYLATVSSPSSPSHTRSARHGGTELRLSEKELGALREKVIPFFMIQHPAKKVTMSGPFAKLRSEEERREALALVEWLGCGRFELNSPGLEKEGVRERLSTAVGWATA